MTIPQNIQQLFQKLIYFHIGKTLYKRKLELTTANLTKKAIQKQLHNNFKTTAGPTNSRYKLRAALRLYDLFHICENVLQNPILQPLKIQYIGKLTELEFQKFSDQIFSIILDYYLEITDSTWTLIELSLEEEGSLQTKIPVEELTFTANYLTIQKESDFQQTALLKGKAITSRLNSSNNTILPAQIAQNANLLDIFPFKFEANKSLFLLSNTAVNKQKAITAIYTEVTQLKQNVDHLVQTVIVTADGMKKTPVEEINNFFFIVNGIIISIKVFVMDASQYQALVRNIWLLKANAEETEQKIFKESRGWKKVRYSTPEPQKKPSYIPLKCKNCKKKLLLMGTCISPKEEYKTRICYFCKAYHKE
ncbi:hypothetical protein G9A89_004530 [Geosiphon pyriformis]|nr:hypothetical protein G9A89_004530 [Geosiphon pyriformis]